MARDTMYSKKRISKANSKASTKAEDFMPTHSGIDQRDRSGAVDKSHSSSFLLLCLTACCCDPSKNNAVAAVNASGKSAHCEISCPDVESGTCNHKASHCEDFAEGNVPCSLIHSTWSTC